MLFEMSLLFNEDSCFKGEDYFEIVYVMEGKAVEGLVY